jgi:hypothetical protein
MLFILAVCDVVIINVNDQINEPVAKMFEVCVSALSSMEQARTPRPIIFFVQNRKYNDSIVLFSLLVVLFFCFFVFFWMWIYISTAVVHDILEALAAGGLDKNLDITKENFITLPVAFNIKRNLYLIYTNIYT